jgi:hypothetical protein
MRGENQQSPIQAFTLDPGSQGCSTPIFQDKYLPTLFAVSCSPPPHRPPPHPFLLSLLLHRLTFSEILSFDILNVAMRR